MLPMLRKSVRLRQHSRASILSIYEIFGKLFGKDYVPSHFGGSRSLWDFNVPFNGIEVCPPHVAIEIKVAFASTNFHAACNFNTIHLFFMKIDKMAEKDFILEYHLKMCSKFRNPILINARPIPFDIFM